MRVLGSTTTGLLALSLLIMTLGCKGEEAAASPSASGSRETTSPKESPVSAVVNESTPSTGKATVVKAEVVPVNEGLPADNKTVPHFQVIWEWKNDGATPIGTLRGDVHAFDKAGGLTSEAKDQLLFAKYDDEKEAVAPGATMKIEKGQGHSMTDLKAGDPVRAEVTITYAGPITKIPG
ncbi:hypothetical protein EON77_08510 [bacterium]|nr:MAG: hypothetical protein EON77_08510 [bacterium]